jgi:hypothetical protein
MPQIEVDGLRSDAVTALYSHRSSSEPFYATSLQHILAELERIDLLVQCQVARARHLQPAADPYHGLCITEQEVDALLARPRGAPRWTTADGPGCEMGSARPMSASRMTPVSAGPKALAGASYCVSMSLPGSFTSRRSTSMHCSLP